MKYQVGEHKIPFDIELLQTVTDGGLDKKSFNLIAADNDMLKTTVLCHLASANLMQGLKILYITLDKSVKQITDMMDANLLNINFDELEEFDPVEKQKKIDRVCNSTSGTVFIVDNKIVDISNIEDTVRKYSLLHLPDIVYIDFIDANNKDYKRIIKDTAKALESIDTVVFTSILFDDISDNKLLFPFTDLELEVYDYGDEEISFNVIKNNYMNSDKTITINTGIDYDHMRMYDLYEAEEIVLINNFRGFK